MGRDEDKEEVRRAYSTPSSPAAFTAPAALYRHFGGRISKDVIKEVLEEEDSYNLHKEYHKPLKYNTFYILRRRQMAQVDLVEVQALAQQNDGVRYLMTIISAFSRKIWVYPMKDKKAQTAEAALSDWLGGLRHKFKILQSDLGKEFVNHRVRALLEEHGVKHQLATTKNKNSYVERSQKTVQIRLYKLLTHRETLRYIDHLEDIVKGYNNNPHRGIGYMTPNDADKKSNEVKVRGILRKKHAKIKRQKPRFSLNQMVRIKTDSKRPSSSRRAYAEQYHLEFFKIVRINQKLPIPLYYLQSLDTEEVIEDGFYGNELSAVRLRDGVWKIEKILRTRRKRGGRRGEKEALVKWQGFSDRWNSWVDEREVREV